MNGMVRCRSWRDGDDGVDIFVWLMSALRSTDDALLFGFEVILEQPGRHFAWPCSSMRVRGGSLSSESSYQENTHILVYDFTLRCLQFIDEHKIPASRSLTNSC